MTIPIDVLSWNEEILMDPTPMWWTIGYKLPREKIGHSQA